MKKSSYASKENRMCVFCRTRLLRIFYASRFTSRDYGYGELTESRKNICIAREICDWSSSIGIITLFKIMKWWKDNKMKVEEECRTAWAIFSQVWRTSRHNRLAKCGTPDHPSVSILMVISQPSFARSSSLYEVFILKTKFCHIN